MSTASAVETDPTPSPAPASEVVPTIPPPGRRLSSKDAFAGARARVDGDGLAEAERTYSGDDDREREDIKLGRHPLQRGGRSLDAHALYEAEVTALRAKLGG